MIIQSESLEHTTNYETNGKSGSTSAGPALLYTLDEHRQPEPDLPSGFMNIDDFIGELENDPQVKKSIAETRKWACDEMYGSEPRTIRTLRMEKGWSQTKLAHEMLTTQPQIAKIENRDASKMHFETCQKLCNVFVIEMNELAELLANQNSLIEARHND